MNKKIFALALIGVLIISISAVSAVRYFDRKGDGESYKSQAKSMDNIEILEVLEHLDEIMVIRYKYDISVGLNYDHSEYVTMEMDVIDPSTSRNQGTIRQAVLDHATEHFNEWLENDEIYIIYNQTRGDKYQGGEWKTKDNNPDGGVGE